VDHARLNLARRALGRTGLMLSRIGFGAFKVGRDVGIKYEQPYALPNDDESDRLLLAVVDDLGINYVDTAPAYGLSEQRVGRALGERADVVISTKVGEAFVDNASRFDFSERSVRESLAESRARLKRDVLDLVFVHSHNDMLVLEQTDVVPTLLSARQRGEVRFIGFSSKSAAGSRAALSWADAIMAEYHLDDRSQESAMVAAAEAGVGVIVKKGLASGRLRAAQAIPFVLANPAVTCMVVGGLNLDHLRSNVTVAATVDVLRDQGAVS
jgi:aryl-alcohol dehydrogenase-like predicted oxidoreductase